MSGDAPEPSKPYVHVRPKPGVSPNRVVDWRERDVLAWLLHTVPTVTDAVYDLFLHGAIHGPCLRHLCFNPKMCKLYKQLIPDADQHALLNAQLDILRPRIRAEESPEEAEFYRPEKSTIAKTLPLQITPGLQAQAMLNLGAPLKDWTVSDVLYWVTSFTRAPEVLQAVRLGCLKKDEIVVLAEDNDARAAWLTKCVPLVCRFHFDRAIPALWKCHIEQQEKADQVRQQARARMLQRQEDQRPKEDAKTAAPATIPDPFKNPRAVTIFQDEKQTTTLILPPGVNQRDIASIAASIDVALAAGAAIGQAIAAATGTHGADEELDEETVA